MYRMDGAGFLPTYWIDVAAYCAQKCAFIRAHAWQEPERFVTTASRQAGFRGREANDPSDARADLYPDP